MLLLAVSAAAQNTQAFQEAQRHGEDRPGSSLHWNFTWNGKDVQIQANGSGTVDGKSLQVPLNSTRLTGKLHFATYDGELLLLVEETDEESGAGKLVRFASKTLKPKWSCDIPNINVGPGLVEGKFAYLSARATAMKVDLESGKWEWRKNNLNRIDESTAIRFNAFGVPTVNGQSVTFPELSNDGSPSGSITLNKANGELIEL
jgi:hypothetical protein